MTTQGKLKLSELLTAVTMRLASANEELGTISRNFDELPEGVNEVPLLEVYPASRTPGGSGQANTLTFGGGVKPSVITIFADVYARQRVSIGEDMAALVPLIEAIDGVLDEENGPKHFGLTGIQSFTYSWEETIFTYGDESKKFLGVKYTLTFNIA